jgi:hypothetical protein
MDFEALQIELNARLHGNIANPAFLVQLKTWTNLARKYIVALNPDWDFLQTTTIELLIADQIEYTLAADLVKINQDEVILTASRKVIEHLDVRGSGSPDITSGEPTHFRLAGYQTIQLLGPPSSAVVTAETSFTYEYSKTFPTDMVGNTDPHLLPFHLEPALIGIAESLGWQYLRQPQASEGAWRKALSTLQALSPETELFSQFALNQEPTNPIEKQGR